MTLSTETRGRRTRTVTARLSFNNGPLAWQAVQTRDIGEGQSWHTVHGEGVADSAEQALALALATFPKEWNA